MTSGKRFNLALPSPHYLFLKGLNLKELSMKKGKLSYAEMLKDPRWQKKRLEVMQRDGFRCQHCLSEDKPLQVHHLVYDKDKNRGSMITIN